MSAPTMYRPESVPKTVWREVCAANRPYPKKNKTDPEAFKAWWEARQLEAKVLASKYATMAFLQSRIGWQSDPWIMREIAKLDHTTTPTTA